jgi:hypothetical protein
MAHYLGPTAHGYYFHASGLPADIYMPSPLEPEGFPNSSTIIVHVRDVNHAHVDGMPVTFQLLPKCEGIATLSATRAVTRGGKAEVTLSAKDTGACHVAIRVDNVTQEMWIDVNPAYEGPEGER